MKQKTQLAAVLLATITALTPSCNQRQQKTETPDQSESTFKGVLKLVPTLQKLADNGLTFTQWHTVALCSPTRSTILTGRNHHLNGMAAITEAATGFPGSSGRIPEKCATIAQILQDNGWSTFWLGKNHNVPEQDVASGASRKLWPLQMGFDRFYGFLGGETNQWYPDLVEDNQFIEPPYSPEEGYHLSKDRPNTLNDWRISCSVRPEKLRSGN